MLDVGAERDRVKAGTRSRGARSAGLDAGTVGGKLQGRLPPAPQRGGQPIRAVVCLLALLPDGAGLPAVVPWPCGIVARGARSCSLPVAVAG